MKLVKATFEFHLCSVVWEKAESQHINGRFYTTVYKVTVLPSGREYITVQSPAMTASIKYLRRAKAEKD